jgi:hypothetical protein
MPATTSGLRDLRYIVTAWISNIGPFECQPGERMSNPIVLNNDSVTGKYFPVFRYALCILALAASAGTARAQYLKPQWNRMTRAPTMTPDDSWGLATYGRGGSRMVSDAQGILFISQGDELYMGISGVRTKASPALPSHFPDGPLRRRRKAIYWSAGMPVTTGLRSIR